MIGPAGPDIEGPTMPGASEDMAVEPAVGEGSPRCGQTALMAKTSPPTLKSAMGSKGPTTILPVPDGRSASWATLANCAMGPIPSDTKADISVNEDVERLGLPGADPGASAPPEGRT
jgi:hypothetical protein